MHVIHPVCVCFWMIEQNVTKDSSCYHTVPAQKSDISKKIIAGKSLTFSFLIIIDDSYFLPGYHITWQHITGSQTTHYRSTSSQSRPHFSRSGQQDLYFPPIIENLLIYFFSNMDPEGAVWLACSSGVAFIKKDVITFKIWPANQPKSVLMIFHWKGFTANCSLMITLWYRFSMNKLT